MLKQLKYWLLLHVYLMLVLLFQNLDLGHKLITGNTILFSTSRFTNLETSLRKTLLPFLTTKLSLAHSFRCTQNSSPLDYEKLLLSICWLFSLGLHEITFLSPVMLYECQNNIHPSILSTDANGAHKLFSSFAQMISTSLSTIIYFSLLNIAP